jgi:hypothetical protein
MEKKDGEEPYATCMCVLRNVILKRERNITGPKTYVLGLFAMCVSKRQKYKHNHRRTWRGIQSIIRRRTWRGIQSIIRRRTWRGIQSIIRNGSLIHGPVEHFTYLCCQRSGCVWFSNEMDSPFIHIFNSIDTI